ncbi:hypothetical protein [Adhaeribacter arboris]|nr:hypothetical protein [Adhaeribacter arboris]
MRKLCAIFPLETRVASLFLLVITPDLPERLYVSQKLKIAA